MPTQSPIKLRDADDLNVNTSATQLDNTHKRPTLAVGGPDTADGIAPCTAADGLSVKITNPGDISGGGGSVSPETRNDTYTAVGNGTAINASTKNLKYFGMRVKGTGAAADGLDREPAAQF